MQTISKKTLRAILLGCLLSIFSTSTWAETNMRCGNAIIGSNATMAEVQAKCGEPAQKRHSTIPAKYKNRFGEWVIDEQQSGGEVDEWVYDFGPNKLMMQVRFLDGALQDVKTLGYGN